VNHGHDSHVADGFPECPRKTLGKRLPLSCTYSLLGLFSISPCIFIFRVTTSAKIACLCCVPCLCRVFLYWYTANHVFAEFRKRGHPTTRKSMTKLHLAAVIHYKNMEFDLKYFLAKYSLISIPNLYATSK
jgi:hypothetical protein